MCYGNIDCYVMAYFNPDSILLLHIHETKGREKNTVLSDVFN